MIIFYVGRAPFELEKLEAVTECRHELAGQQDGSNKNGRVGLAVEAMDNNDILRIFLQKLETFFDRL